MTPQFDFKKEWEKTKDQLIKISKEAAIIAKKGEEELVKFSQKGKMRMDATAAGLKKEQLYYLIGKEYVKVKEPGKQSAQLKKLVEEMGKIEKEQRLLQKKLKTVQ